MFWICLAMIVVSAVTLVLVAAQWWFPPQPVPEWPEEEYWECENCGFIVYSATMEGIVEGMRIHSVATECEFEWEDDDDV